MREHMQAFCLFFLNVHVDNVLQLHSNRADHFLLILCHTLHQHFGTRVIFI